MLNVDINVDRRTDGLTDGRTDERTDGQKIGRLYHTLLQAGVIKNYPRIITKDSSITIPLNNKIFLYCLSADLH